MQIPSGVNAQAGFITNILVIRDFGKWQVVRDQWMGMSVGINLDCSQTSNSTFRDQGQC